MKFPESLLNVDDYYQTIENLLDDDECQIFLDTNIFALFFKFHSAARQDFFEWINPLISKKRINTPVWALNEYTNRFIRRKTSDYIDTLTKLKPFENQFLEIKRFLEMNIDTDNLHSRFYSSRENYLTELNIVASKLALIAQATKGKKDDYIKEVHDEIKAIFEQTVIQTEIFDIVDEAEKLSISRYKNKLPPGFEDDIKRENKIGDLIIWKEILSFCKDKDFKKTLILTNDGKKDWVYGPLKVIENGNEINNPHNKYKIIDNRLVYEYKLSTEYEIIHIINFETLLNLLVKKGGNKFKDLARAYNLIQQEEIETEREVEESGQDVSDNFQEPTEGIAVSILVDLPESTLEGSERTTEIPSGEPTNNELTVNPPKISSGQAGTQSNQEDMYSKVATADSKFTMNNVDILSEIISGLKSYNWYEQNPQIDKILSLGNLVLPNTQKNRDKIFVVGRNIYQAASGGAFRAMEFIENLESNLAAFNDFISNHLYSGMFYEIYFNSKGEFRNGNFKAAFYEQLFKLQTKDRYQTSINFILNSLNEYSDNLLVLPSPSPNIVKFHIYTEPKTDDFFGVLNKVTKITAGQKELLTENPDFHFSSSITEGIEELQDRLRQVFLVPAEQSSFNFYPENRNSILYFIPNNKSLMIRKRKNEASN